MRVLGVVAGLAAMFSAANAATVAVSNGNFEDPYALTNPSSVGPWEAGAAGWSHEGGAGTWAPDKSKVYASTPGDLGDRVGIVANGAKLYQSLGITISGDTDYILTAAIGDRLNGDFGGTFGFYVGDPSNIIASAALTTAGDGLWTLQNVTAAATAISAFVGQELGIFFAGAGWQFNVDNVSVEAMLVDGIGDAIENPLPAAVWLFGSALAAGGFASRRKRNRTAA